MHVSANVLKDANVVLEDVDEGGEHEEILIGRRKALLKCLRVNHVASFRHLKVFAVLYDDLSDMQNGKEKNSSVMI